jgi:hypothetical protein
MLICRFGSEHKTWRPSSGFRIQSSYTIGAFDVCSCHRKKRRTLNCSNVSDAKNLRAGLTLNHLSSRPLPVVYQTSEQRFDKSACSSRVLGGTLDDSLWPAAPIGPPVSSCSLRLSCRGPQRHCSFRSEQEKG